jgi:hypothetical protein
MIGRGNRKLGGGSYSFGGMLLLLYKAKQPMTMPVSMQQQQQRNNHLGEHDDDFLGLLGFLGRPTVLTDQLQQLLCWWALGMP